MAINYLEQKKDHLILHLYVQPRASQNAMVGLYNNALKVRIKAPPVAGAANKMCLKFMAKALHLSPKSLKLIAGHNSRRKTIQITPARPDELSPLEQKIRAWISESA